MFILSFVVLLYYSFKKLFLSENLNNGIEGLIVGIYLVMGVFLFLLGMLGEYIRSLHIRSQNRPVVTIKEKINIKN